MPVPPKSREPRAPRPTTAYAFDRALLVRAMGILLLVNGVVVFGVAALTVVASVSGLVLSVVVVLAALVLVTAGTWLGRMRTMVRFDDDGYQVRVLRGAGVKQARWRDVEDVVTTTSAGQDCVVLRLRDGRTTTIPLGVLEGSRQVFVDDLRSRLDRGHGYRRLR
ncbi:hypothetical protein [Nocardioides marmoribigeumensis]|jgi:hypothetical protein|uniref:PH domain-containing protein n=1 Tax=Nocardioides marmoribigeumensis TaxID=433649 RepID=A0ABU2BV45_9ACTN|nr:hypothetical protein [Nocardioides marmoribigeumensis]MDR7362506.1 hypothetical protein [Nocardioides marmoribigeumensis]